jgi:rhodanese-related sulfurtransferase
VRSAAFAQQQAGRITLADFKKQYDQGQVIVLDVRPPEAYGLGHIRGAISTPEQGVGKRAAEWTAAGKPVVTYCS